MLKLASRISAVAHSRGGKVVLLAFCMFLLLLPGRATVPPFDRDEPRYMQATAQMLETDNFLDVRFQDKPRYLQPAGIYWLEAASVALSGTLKQRDVWAYRVPSLLAMTAAIALTAWMGAALFGTEAGLMAGALLGTSVLVAAEGRMATIDSTLLLVVMLAETMLLRVLLDRKAGRPTLVWTAILFWGALGCGLMLKGPVILIPGLATPVAFSVVERDWSWLKRLRPAWGWLVTVAVVLPWCVAIGVISHGAFFQNAVGHNFLGKIGSGQEAHGGFPGFHLAVFAIAFWPGSFFVAASLPVIRAWRSRWEVRFLVCWIVPHWLLFELIATKLPHYVLPTYPAIAILTGAALASSSGQWNMWPQSKWGRGLLAFYGAIWVLVGVSLAVAGIALTSVLNGEVPAAAWIAAGGSLPLIGIATREVVQGRLWRAAMCSCGAAAVIYSGLFIGVVDELTPIWLAPRLVDLVEEYRPCPDTEVVSSSFSEPSFVFLMHGKVKLENPAEGGRMLARNPACGLVLVARKDQASFEQVLVGTPVRPVEYGRVRGFNYSTGKWLDIGLYGASSP